MKKSALEPAPSKESAAAMSESSEHEQRKHEEALNQKMSEPDECKCAEISYGGPDVIVDTVKTIFAAAQTDDVAMLNTVVAPDFYIYDGGARFNGKGILALVKAQHAARKRIEWNITEPDVHISGNTAWIAYVDKGSITDASGTTNQKWLKSAFLEKQAGVWKVVFMQSTRVPARR